VSLRTCARTATHTTPITSARQPSHHAYEGAVISEVARRHGIRPQQLFAWRRQVRDHVPTASFAPVVVEMAPPALPSAPPHANGATAAEIEIAIGMVVIRVRGAADIKMLTAVLRAVRAAS